MLGSREGRNKQKTLAKAKGCQGLVATNTYVGISVTPSINIQTMIIYVTRNAGQRLFMDLRYGD
jgi:hypothetical protein